MIDIDFEAQTVLRPHKRYTDAFIYLYFPPHTLAVVIWLLCGSEFNFPLAPPVKFHPTKRTENKASWAKL
jgi:hypothetical protein